MILINAWVAIRDNTARIFLRQILAPSQLKIEQKLHRMMNYIPNIHFGENFMKIGQTIWESYRCLHYIHLLMQIVMSNFNVNPYSDLLWFEINLKCRSCSFKQNELFPILMAQLLFFPIQLASGLNFRKVWKSCTVCSMFAYLVTTCITWLFANCKGGNFNIHNLGVVRLFHLLRKGNQVLLAHQSRTLRVSL